MRNQYKSISARLRSGAPSQRDQKPSVEAVSQVHVSLHGDGKSDIFEAARTTVLTFIKRRAGGSLPPEALEGKSFITDDVETRRVESVSIDNPRYWALRFDDDDKNVAGRSWVIEIAIAQTKMEKSVLFGLRLQCVARRKNPLYTRSIPTVVQDIIEKYATTLDGYHISLTPWLVDTKEDVKKLVNLLRKNNRYANVIVISLPDNYTDVNSGLISGESISKKLAGAAHVVAITDQASHHLNNMIGREFSVFNQGVRTYRPGFDPDTQTPFMHPLYLAKNIRSWRLDRGKKLGKMSNQNFIIKETLRQSVEGLGAQTRVPLFLDAKRASFNMLQKNAKASGVSERELIKTLIERNKELDGLNRTTEEEYRQLLGIAEDERNDAEAENHRLKKLIHELQNKIQSIEVQERNENQEDFPKTLDELEEWANENLVGFVEVHNRAIRAAKKSRYKDVSLVYNALLLLRNYYVPMKRKGGRKLISAFNKRCRELELEESPLSDSTAGQQGDEYFIRVEGRRIFLDRHLKKGNARDRARCFRLYFFWDDDTRQVIVGWLPSHLKTRAS